LGVAHSKKKAAFTVSCACAAVDAMAMAPMVESIATFVLLNISVSLLMPPILTFLWLFA
jgi:hypothetical protein